MARCLAAAINQAPGLSGTPDSGHCSSAATRASCARSSASPTSRTIRVRPAMSLGDSILHTASIVRCVSVAVTAPDHITFRLSAQDGTLRLASALLSRRLPLSVLSEILRPEDLTNFGLAFPSRPVFLVKAHEVHR